ncbi:Uncharacterised protein [Serratia fonticola]|nr:Uncharacterised protein [Serratia fonticola]
MHMFHLIVKHCYLLIHLDLITKMVMLVGNSNDMDWTRMLE